MNFEQLLYVEVLSQSKSLHQAAKALHISIPGLSTSISQLEAELGFPIFNRNYGGTTLTKEGNEILNSVLQVLKAKNQLDKVTAQINSNVHNEKITIQYVSTKLTPVINECIAEFLETTNDVYLDIRVGHGSSVINNVRSHRIDAGYLALSNDELSSLPNNLEFLPVCTSSMSIMVGPNSKLYHYHGKLTTDLLKKQRYCIFNDPFNHKTFDQLQFVCGPLDLALSSDDGAFLVNSITTNDLVGIGRNVKLKDRYWADKQGLQYIDLNDLVPSSFQFGVLINKDENLPEATEKFIKKLNQKIIGETKK
ncbi:LysR family transcriptional regulator [Limosilactobacillus sp.]|uniref:LysR family transcriptional regulator n=1 Tax=Limosilactobacillus sp. TaxID=2773925 RepID=UPI003EFD0080